MALALPRLAVCEEGNGSVQLHPGHIDLLQLLPLGVALGGRHLRVGVDLVLEVVHQGAVGDKGEGPGQMTVQIFFGIRTEEALRPGPGHELHGHGVDLTGLHPRPDVTGGHPIPVHPAGKGVARLVGDHLHIPLGSVEVGKNEGHLVVHDAGAVAAAGLALGGQHVQQFILQHGAEKLAGLRGQLIIELLPLGQDIVRRPLRTGIAGAKFQGVVRVAQRVLYADPAGLLLENPVGQRHQVLAHGGAELLHILLGIAVAAHSVIAQGGISLIAQLFAHLIPKTGQFVINAVQVALVVLVPAPHCLPGGQAAGIVRIGGKGGHLGDGILPILKGNFGGGDELLVLLRQIVLLLKLGHNLRGESLQGDLGVEEHQVAVLRFKVLAEGGLQHGQLPRLLVLLQLGNRGVPKVHLAIVELVPGVDGVADTGQGAQGFHMAVGLLLLQKHSLGLVIALRLLQTSGELSQLPLKRLQFRALIGHLRKSHGASSFDIFRTSVSRETSQTMVFPFSTARVSRSPPSFAR